jgi:NitT/TauT family transport system ATP-binding protein
VDDGSRQCRLRPADAGGTEAGLGADCRWLTHSIDEALVLGDRVLVMTAQPGRIKADLAIDFPRPREVYRLKATPEFGQIAYRVWELLKEEIMRAKALEATV